MRRTKITVEVVPLIVAQKVLATELEQKRAAQRAKLLKSKLAKSGQN